MSTGRSLKREKKKVIRPEQQELEETVPARRNHVVR